DGTGFEVIRSASVALPLKTWFHYAVSYTHWTQQVKFYVNGALVDTLTTTKSSIVDTTDPLLIGRFHLANTIETWWGMIKEVRIWKIVRTDQQIQDDYKAPLT